MATIDKLREKCRRQILEEEAEQAWSFESTHLLFIIDGDTDGVQDSSWYITVFCTNPVDWTDEGFPETSQLMSYYLILPLTIS